MSLALEQPQICTGAILGLLAPEQETFSGLPCLPQKKHQATKVPTLNFLGIMRENS